MDTDNDGHVDIDEWEECIEVALANKIAERQAKRELEAKQANKEIEEFTNDFKNAARKCFQMIDKDGGGTLSTDEIVTAVKEDKVANAASYDRAPFNFVCGGAGTTERRRHTSRRSQDVIHFLKTCGEENLQFLLVPARLKKSLDYLDTDGSGELDVDEWEAAINRGLAKRLEQMADERARAARAAEKADAEFSAEFLNAAREVFLMIDKDDSGSLDREEIVASSVLSRRRRGRADCIERQKRHRAGVASMARRS